MPNFEQKPMNYAKEYAQSLANAYPYLSYFAEVYTSPNNSDYQPIKGDTVMIPSMSVSGAKPLIETLSTVSLTETSTQTMSLSK